jgi:putative Ca2+/H+ antiporter (TMEM165/GDT1 family)
MNNNAQLDGDKEAHNKAKKIFWTNIGITWILSEMGTRRLAAVLLAAEANNTLRVG